MPHDDYQKVREIELGSFGRTFLVRRETDKKVLAMKEFDISRFSQQERLDALEEMQALSGLKHPFLIRYCEKFVHGRMMCMVAEDCDEGTLWGFTKLCSKQRAIIPEAQVTRWFAQISLAVKYLHERPRPILHRDIKLQNVLLVKQNSIDVGSAKLFVEFGPMRILDSQQSLVQGRVGTQFCEAPEISNRLPYSTPADVWALGCVLYELCTAHMAWESVDIPEHIENVMIAPFSSVSGLYSTELGQVAAALLSHDPSERPSVAEVLKTGMLQSEIRHMLMDRRKGGGNKVEAKGGDEVHAKDPEPRNHPRSDSDARPSACPSSARSKYLPRSARSASPNVVQSVRATDDCPAAPRPCTRPLGDHNPRVPRTARSPSPHEAAKMLLMAQIPDSPRHRGRISQPGHYSNQEGSCDHRKRMQEAAAILLMDPVDVE